MEQSFLAPSWRRSCLVVLTLFCVGTFSACSDTKPDDPGDNNNPEEQDPTTKDPETKDPETNDPTTKDPDDQTGDCTNGAVNSEGCGLNDQGVQLLNCEDGAWVPNGDCVDPDRCTNGENDSQACGLNGDGTQSVICDDGQWVANGSCDDAAACKNDSEHILSCGLNNNGQQRVRCEDGAWVDVGDCQEGGDACNNGDTWSQLCGANLRGQQQLVCENGQWKEEGDCLSDEECTDGDTQNADCGLNGRGTLAQRCVIGFWQNEGVCDESAAGQRVQGATFSVINTRNADDEFDGKGVWAVAALNHADPPSVLFFDLHHLVITDADGNRVTTRIEENDATMTAFFETVHGDDESEGTVRTGWYTWSLTDENDDVIGGGNFEIRSNANEDKNFNLSGFSIRIAEAGEIAMVDEKSELVTPTHSASTDTETRNDYLALSNVIYSYDAMPTREEAVTARGKKYNPQKLLVTLPIQVRVDFPIHVTKGANFEVYRKVADNPVSPEHYIAYLPIDYEYDEANSTDDYDAYLIEAPSNVLFHIEASIPGETVKHIEMFRMTAPPAELKVIDLEDIDETMVGDNGYKEADILTNVDDSHVLSLGLGDDDLHTFDLDVFRIWQAMKGDSSNYFVDPNYLVDVQGDDAIVAKRTYSPGREQVVIEAVSPGVSVITLGYEPIHLFDSFSFVMWGSEPPPPGQNGDDDFFNAIEPSRLGIVIVQVGEKNVDNIDMGIHTTVFDTFYYNRPDDHADFTFTPTADKELEVCVHTPLHQAAWNTDWHCFDPNDDASYTISLTEGRNIVRARTENAQQFYVLRAMPLDITIVNAADESADIHVGDDVLVTMKGLSTPLPKLSNIYNPGFPNGVYIEYDLDGETLIGERTQYAIANHGKITVEGLDAAGTYTLENGRINSTLLGQQPGAHRGVSRGGSHSGYTGGDASVGPKYSFLPDITIEVAP